MKAHRVWASAALLLLAAAGWLLPWKPWLGAALRGAAAHREPSPPAFVPLYVLAGGGLVPRLVFKPAGCMSCWSGTHEGARGVGERRSAAACGGRVAPAVEAVAGRGAEVGRRAPRTVRARVRRAVRAGERVSGSRPDSHARGRRDLRTGAGRGAGVHGEPARGQRGVLHRPHVCP